MATVIQCDMCKTIDPGRGDEFSRYKLPPVNWLSFGWHVEGDSSREGNGGVTLCSLDCLKDWAASL